MLLQKLAQYFERLEDQAPAMYVKTRIRSLIELDSEGRFHGLVATEGGMKGKKDRGKRFFAPHLGRSSAIQAKLLADNAEYVLGLARDSEKQKRVDECHQAFVEEVRKCADFTGEPAVQAVLKFLDEWQPGSIPLSEEFDPSDVVTFRVDGVLPIELASVKKYWASYATPGGDAGLPSAKTEGELMQCLICGRLRPAVSRLPFKIKGVPGGQTSGMALISANSPAFESYGLEASLIAPTCQECGERFSKAANALIEGESTHIRIPPLVYIFWTREESDFNPARLLSTPEPDEVKALIGSAFTGAKSALRVDGAHFYATALSASGARVAVRDWIDTTVEEAKRNLAHYFALQRIVEWNGAEGKPLGLYALAASTVRDANTELPAHVPQSLLRMALRGGQLPLGLLFQAVKRNRAEQAVTRPRAALVKMVLLSQEPKLSLEDTMTQLDPGNRDAAYLCGRLMGILESVQRAALGDVGANVTSRFFGTASSAPASVFGNLLRGAQPHLQKLKKERRATYEALERRLEEVMASLPGFPRVLTLEEQGLFSLGYFHQRAADRAAAIAHKKAKEPGDQGQDNADQLGGKSDSDAIYMDVKRRHDFVLLFDVTDGNPNGDPDAGNLPRVDPETMHGLVTDVCLKRKMRNYVDATRGKEARYKIFVENRGFLADHKQRAYEAVGAKKGDDSKMDQARSWMCANYFDVRAFGAVLVGKKGEGYNCGQVRGPSQLTFARSVDRVVPLDLSITRVALENRGDKPDTADDEEARTGTMGRKTLVPYGLYRSHGFFSPFFAEDTGVSNQDLGVFWEALQNMWDLDRSASRGLMACRGLYVFTHEKASGNAPAHVLFDGVAIKRKDGVEAPRSFADYDVGVVNQPMPAGAAWIHGDHELIPEGVSLTRLV